MKNSNKDNSQGGLKVFACDWSETGLTVDQQTIADLIDRIAVGQSSPRIWVFLAEPDHDRAAVAAALTTARILDSRGKAITIIDGDDQQQRLTRWADRVEQDGWVDMIRMGGSPKVCSIPFGQNGEQNRLIGVGSFAPSQLTNQEVDDFIDRIKLQADDLVIVAPTAGPGLLWASRAQIRVLCRDKAGDFSEADGLVDRLQEIDSPLTALLELGTEDVAPVAAGTVAGTAEPVSATRNRNVDWDKAKKVPRSHHVFWGVAAVLLVTIGFMLGMMWRPNPSDQDQQPAQLVPAVVSNVASAVAEVTPRNDNQAEQPADETPAQPAAIANSDATTGAVGAAGWAVHVYSFPEKEIAIEEVRKLVDRGYNAEFKKFDLAERGIWYRVYVGSYDSKEAADTARGEMAKTLDLDWALAVKY